MAGGKQIAKEQFWGLLLFYKFSSYIELRGRWFSFNFILAQMDSQPSFSMMQMSLIKFPTPDTSRYHLWIASFIWPDLRTSLRYSKELQTLALE